MTKSIPKILQKYGNAYNDITCMIDTHSHHCTDDKGHRDVELYLRDVGLELAERWKGMCVFFDVDCQLECGDNSALAHYGDHLGVGPRGCW